MLLECQEESKKWPGPEALSRFKTPRSTSKSQTNLHRFYLYLGFISWQSNIILCMLYKGRISKWEEGQIPIQFCSVKEPVDLKYFPSSLLAVPTHFPELGRHHSSQENERSLPVCPGTHRGPPDTNAQQLGVPWTLQLCPAWPIPREAPRNKLQAGPRQGRPPNKRSIHGRRMVPEGVKHRLWRQGTPPAPWATGKGL